MITIIHGPMWSGKTTKLTEIAKRYKNVVAFDCYNLRNTNRDLHNIFTCQCLFHVVDYSNVELVIFDEVHLVQVFAHSELDFRSRIYYKSLFFSHLKHAAEKCDVVLAGLLYDCYNEYKPFSIWSDIEAMLGEKVHCKLWLESTRPCCECGTTNGVVYTKPTCLLNIGQRIGDHYDNVCVKCVRGNK